MRSVQEQVDSTQQCSKEWLRVKSGSEIFFSHLLFSISLGCLLSYLFFITGQNLLDKETAIQSDF